MTLQERETELRKRLKYPYNWGCKQNDHYDDLTRFIYRLSGFEELEEEARRTADSHGTPILFDYALNRWFNFWSAQAVEEVFYAQVGVTPALDRRDPLVDFDLKGITFDHKTSVFPKAFKMSLEHARAHPAELIKWLYENQSQQKRKHLRNRLFIVLHAHNGAHWELKSEVTWLASIVEDYVTSFRPDQLHELKLESGSTTFSDIIWAIRPRER